MQKDELRLLFHTAYNTGQVTIQATHSGLQMTKVGQRPEEGPWLRFTLPKHSTTGHWAPRRDLREQRKATEIL